MGFDQNVIKQQYSNQENLQARIALHAQFATNPLPWQRWVFDQFHLPLQARILEVGSGTGALWQENLDRIPSDWHIILTDRSDSMVASSQTVLSKDAYNFTFAIADILALPYDDDSFDAVIANHMLYHVEPLPSALREIQRVLKPTGHLYTTTNGAMHMHELAELVYSFDSSLDDYRSYDAQFRLENGKDLLQNWFSNVEMRVYINDLQVTAVHPIISYLQSTMGQFRQQITGPRLEAFRAHVANAIATGNGAFHITRSSGLFIAQKT